MCINLSNIYIHYRSNKKKTNKQINLIENVKSVWQKTCKRFALKKKRQLLPRYHLNKNMFWAVGDKIPPPGWATGEETLMQGHEQSQHQIASYFTDNFLHLKQHIWK